MSSSSRCAGPERRALVAAALMALPMAMLPRPSHALARRSVPPEVAATLHGAALRGHGVLRFLGMAVVEARLWAPAPVSEHDWVGQPIALELVYARALDGRRIVERSIDEMRRQAAIDESTAGRWRDAMTRLFPDVGRGDRLTGVMQPPGRDDPTGTTSRFFFNAQPRGELRDAEFARLFFGIWLAPQTSEPALRARLLGAQPGP